MNTANTGTADRAFSGQMVTVIEQVRTGFAHTLAIALIVLPLVGLASRTFVGSEEVSSIQVIMSIALVLIGAACFYLTRRGRIAAAGLVADLALLTAVFFVVQPEIRVLLSLLAVIIAATLTGRVVFYITVVVTLLVQFFNFIGLMAEEGFRFDASATSIPISAVTILVVAVLFRYFYNVAVRTSRAAETSFQRLTSIASVGRQTSRLQKLNELLSDSVNLIQKQFGFYHVQIFLVDDRREYAVLVASTGEAGRRLLSRNHKLGVGSQSVIGRTTLANEPVLINDTESEPGHAFNPLLPETRAELALPMQVQIDGENRVMGALDVQSEEPLAFSATDVQALQALANQLAIAIRNAQLFEAQEISLSENQRLYDEANRSLEEIQRLNRQLTRDAWDGYIGSHEEVSGVYLDGDSVVFNPGWTELMIEACAARDTITDIDDGARVTATPMMVRGEVIGAVEVVGGNEEELNLVEAIVAFTERFAVALENLRLIEEAQAASAQQQHISAVVSRFQEAETVDELLQITLTELADTFDADGGSIRIGIGAGASGQTAR